MASTFKGLPIALNLPQFENHEKQEGKYTTCYMCACRCGIKVTVEDNEVRFDSVIAVFSSEVIKGG